ncbi:hypothetical protein D3C84_953580 [compost metagenome]
MYRGHAVVAGPSLPMVSAWRWSTCVRRPLLWQPVAMLPMKSAIRLFSSTPAVRSSVNCNWPICTSRYGISVHWYALARWLARLKLSSTKQ